MSIFGIDWNGDGNLDIFDTAVDTMIINDIESELNYDESDDDK